MTENNTAKNIDNKPDVKQLMQEIRERIKQSLAQDTDDKLRTNNKFNNVFNCATCANSFDLHSAITSFLQFAYDSAIKPHFYNPSAISAIGCSGINGTTRYFTMKKEQKEDFKRVVEDEHTWEFSRVTMPSLKTPRQCCNEPSLEYSAGCSSCSIL